jgi:2-polyprenyl-3-methyl-5-hydroxy-6-metoxy-1,4-benzoquinol methylase
MNEATNRYVMGYTERERRRLGLQAEVQNHSTEALLGRAGLSRGMRVIDLGCGIGDVSLLAARLVGRDGLVIGIDLDERALETARARSQELDVRQVRFERRAIDDLDFGEPFDAVIGRHILIHMRDPIAVLKRAAQLLRPGGVAAFHEYDFSLIQLAYPPSPIREELAGLFAIFIPTANMGARLYHDFLKAGFSFPQCQYDGVIDGGAGNPAYEIFAQAALSILARPEASDLQFSLPRDPEELARCLEREVVANMGSCPPPLQVTAHARRDAMASRS